MHLSEVSLNNFKAFRNLDIKLKPGVNLLVGDNGAGKTSVLDGIAALLGGLFVRMSDVPAKSIVQTDVHRESVAMGDSSMYIQYFEPTVLSGVLETDGYKFDIERIKETRSSSYTKTFYRDAAMWMDEITNQYHAMLPIISYQNAARAWRVKRDSNTKESKKNIDDRRKGYLDSLGQTMDVKTIQKWYMKQEQLAFARGRNVREYENFKSIVSGFMQKINNAEVKPYIYYSRQFEEMVYAENEIEVPLTELSAGYQALLWMIMDIAYRICVLNPLLEDARLVEGIILVDEIDLHLHPKWQWNVINALQYTLPKVQFIMTTHSPIVISSAKDANIVQLNDGDQLVYHESSYGYQVDDVLKYVQESVGRPDKVDKILFEINEALLDDNFDKIETLLKELKEELGEESSEYKNLLNIVNDQKMILDL